MITYDKMTKKQKQQIADFNFRYNQDRIDKNTDFREYVINLSKIKEEDYYKAYYRIVSRTAEFLYESGMNNPFLASSLFKAMLDGGLFSQNRELKFSHNGRINNTMLLGADVIRGKATCVNEAMMESEVLQRMGFDAYRLDGYVYYHDDKGRMLKRDKIGVRLNLAGNHSVVIFEDKGYWYLYDVINHCYMEFDDFFHAKACGKPIDFKVTAPVSSTFTSSYFPAGKFQSMLISAFLNSDTKRLTPKFVEDIEGQVYDKALALVTDEVNPFEDFRQEIEQDIDIVCQKLTRFRMKM